MLDLCSVREEFPAFSQENALIYLDSAATSQKPLEVIEAISHFLSYECGTVHRAVYSLAAEATTKYNQVREQVRAFIGAKHTEEIIFTRGTTEGINLVASSFGRAFLQEGDEILIAESEHHSNIVPWQMICAERKAHLKVIPINDQGEILLDVFQAMLSSRVKLVCVAHIANATGALHPIASMIQMAHVYGAKVLIDAAQSIAHRSIDVAALEADFLVFSSHKMYGPTGVGILYGKKELLESMPPYQGGGDMIQTVSFEKTVYQAPPLRFEAGTPSIAEVIGLGAAIRFLEKIGFQAIEAHDKNLIEYAHKALSCIPGLSFLADPQNRSSILSFNIKDCHPLDVGTLLDLRGISVRTGHLCAQPALKRLGVTSTIRISFGVYNTKQEIDTLVQALYEIVKILSLS